MIETVTLQPQIECTNRRCNCVQHGGFARHLDHDKPSVTRMALDHTSNPGPLYPPPAPKPKPPTTTRRRKQTPLPTRIGNVTLIIAFRETYSDGSSRAKVRLQCGCDRETLWVIAASAWTGMNAPRACRFCSRSRGMLGYKMSAETLGASQ